MLFASCAWVWSTYTVDSVKNYLLRFFFSPSICNWIMIINGLLNSSFGFTYQRNSRNSNYRHNVINHLAITVGAVVSLNYLLIHFRPCKANELTYFLYFFLPFSQSKSLICSIMRSVYYYVLFELLCYGADNIIFFFPGLLYTINVI